MYKLKALNLEDKHEGARVKMLTAIISSQEPLILVPMLDHLITGSKALQRY